VTIYAGSKAEEKSVVVYKDFVCHYSLVLKAAFNSDSIEGQTQEYRVDEEDEEITRLLVHWFYTQQLDVPQLQEYSKSLKADARGKEEMCLVKLWVLADKLLIPQLQNMALDVLDKVQSKRGLASNCLAYVYTNTAKIVSSIDGLFIAVLSVLTRRPSLNTLVNFLSRYFSRLSLLFLNGPRPRLGQRQRRKISRLRSRINERQGRQKSLVSHHLVQLIALRCGRLTEL
jgi:hypothetical protein